MENLRVQVKVKGEKRSYQRELYTTNQTIENEDLRECLLEKVKEMTRDLLILATEDPWQ